MIVRDYLCVEPTKVRGTRMAGAWGGLEIPRSPGSHMKGPEIPSGVRKSRLHPWATGNEQLVLAGYKDAPHG